MYEPDLLGNGVILGGSFPCVLCVNGRVRGKRGNIRCDTCTTKRQLWKQDKAKTKTKTKKKTKT